MHSGSIHISYVQIQIQVFFFGGGGLDSHSHLKSQFGFKKTEWIQIWIWGTRLVHMIW